MKEVYEFLKNCGTYFLATVDGDTEVYYLKNAVAQICAFTEAPREIKF